MEFDKDLNRPGLARLLATNVPLGPAGVTPPAHRLETTSYIEMTQEHRDALDELLTQWVDIENSEEYKKSMEEAVKHLECIDRQRELVE